MFIEKITKKKKSFYQRWRRRC